MDPQAAWNEMIDAFRARDADRVGEHGSALKDWLANGGIPPDAGGQILLPFRDDELYRGLVRAYVNYALYLAAGWEGGER